MEPNDRLSLHLPATEIRPSEGEGDLDALIAALIAVVLTACVERAAQDKAA